MGCAYEILEISVNSEEAKNTFIKVFNAKMKDYLGDWELEKSDFLELKAEYHCKIDDEPLFNYPVQDDLIDTVMEFIEAIPSVKCSSYYYFDGTGGTGYIRLNYDKNVLTLTRKEPEEGLRNSCYVLTEGVWADKNENKCFLIENGCLKKYNGNFKDVIIPDEVTSIGHFAFQKCRGIISVTIPNSTTSIGWSHSQDAQNLKA